MNKTKKKIFHIGLYLQGLRQLMPFIGTATAIILAFTFLIDPGSEFSILLHILSYTVITPMLTFVLFHFLTKRNTSDFYHSLPHTRFCICLSYCASIITYFTAYIVLFMGIALLRLAIFGYDLALESTIPYTLGLWVANFAVMTAIVLAESLNGTLFTTFISSGIIMFAPRIFYTFVLAQINTFCPYISTENWVNILRPNANILYSTATLTLSDVSPDELLQHAFSICYTLILGLVYGGFALYFFNKRKSELAGSVFGRKLQTLIRIVLGTILCLPGLSLLLDNFYDKAYSEDVTDVIMLYVLAIVSYFLYELISTRKIKSLLYALPGLGIIAVLNLLFFFGIIGLEDNFSAFNPTAKDVDYIVVTYTSEGIYDVPRYDDEIMYPLEIRDTQVIHSYCNALKQSIATKDLAQGDNYDSSKMTITFHVNGKKYKRELLGTNEYNDYVEKIKNTAEYQKLFAKNLPSAKDITEIECDRYTSLFSEKMLKDIYSEFLTEIKDNPEAYFNNDEDSFGLHMYFNYNGKSCHLNLAITDAFPKTMELCEKYTTEILCTMLESRPSFKECEYIQVSYAGTNNIGYSFSIDTEEELEEFYEVLLQSPEYQVNCTYSLFDLINTENYIEYSLSPRYSSSWDGIRYEDTTTALIYFSSTKELDKFMEEHTDTYERYEIYSEDEE